MSEADDWFLAKDEWSFLYPEFVDNDYTSCPCGHVIHELCWLKNSINMRETFVGNVCVKKFMGLKTATIFKHFKELMEKPYDLPHTVLLEYALNRNIIGQPEYKILYTRSRLKLSVQQSEQVWLERLNYRILNNITLHGLINPYF